MAAVVAEAGADLCLMHMLGEPRTMQDDPRYDDVVAEVESFLAERAEAAVAAGVAARAHRARSRHRLRQDARAQPRAAARAAAPGAARPAAARASRASASWARSRGREIADDRVAASVAAALYCYRGGAHLLRVHDVRATADALAVERALEGAAC